MLARLRKATEEHDEGFTLIELLVVMIIIGILAAIAIPVFLNQRQKAVDSAMKSDLRTVANGVESYFTDAQSYAALGTDASPVMDDVKLSAGNAIKITATTNEYCITATRASDATSASHDSWSYDSDGGGIVAGGGGCAGAAPAAGAGG